MTVYQALVPDEKKLAQIAGCASNVQPSCRISHRCYHICIQPQTCVRVMAFGCVKYTFGLQQLRARICESDDALRVRVSKFVRDARA